VITLIPTAGYGDIHYDIAYGGSYFIYTDITQFELDIHSSSASHIVSVALELKAAVAASVTLTHPVEDELAFLSAVYFYCGSLGSLSDTISELCIYDDTVSVFEDYIVTHISASL